MRVWGVCNMINSIGTYDDSDLYGTYHYENECYKSPNQSN